MCRSADRNRIIHLLLPLILLIFTSISVLAKVQPSVTPTPTMTPALVWLSELNSVHQSQSNVKTIFAEVEPVSENTQTVTFSLDNGVGVLGYEFEIAYVASTSTIVEGSFKQLLPDSPFINITKKTGLWKVTVSSLTKVQSAESVDLFSIQVQRNPGVTADTPIRLFLTNKTAINKGEFALQVELPIHLFQSGNNPNPITTSTNSPLVNVPLTNTPQPVITSTPVNNSPNARRLTVDVEEISATVRQVNIRIDEAFDIVSYLFELNYDSNAVSIVSGSYKHTLSNKPFGLSNAQNGSLRVVGTSANAVTIGGPQIILSFLIEKLPGAPANQSIEMVMTNASSINDGFIEFSYHPVISLFQTAGNTPTFPLPSPTRNNFPTVTPTSTLIPTASPTPLPRNIMVKIEEVSAMVQNVVVGIDNAQNISVFRFEFSFLSSLLKYVDGSYESSLIPSQPLITNTGNGILRFLTATASPNPQTGPQTLFSFQIERLTLSPDVIPIEMMITSGTSINASAFSLIYNPTILLFEDYTGVPIEPTATPTPIPSNTPVPTATFSPTNTPVIVNTPTNTATKTPTVHNPNARKVTVQVDDVSDNIQKVTVGIDNALDIIGYLIEFTFDPSLVHYVENSKEEILFNRPFEVTINRDGALRFVAASNFPSTLSGQHGIISFHMERNPNAEDNKPIEIMISNQTTLNDNAIPITFDPIIKLFDDGSGEEVPNESSVIKIFEFGQADLNQGWNLIPGGFNGAKTGIMIPEFNLRRVMLASLDNMGFTLIVNPLEVVLLHTTEPIETNGFPVLLRLTARSISKNGTLALAALKGSITSGAGLDGSVATNIPANTENISKQAGTLVLVYQPGTETKFTPVIQLAANSKENHETVFLDRLEIIRLDKAIFGLNP